MNEVPNNSVNEQSIPADTEETYNRTNRFLPQYFQMDIADSVGKYDALGRDCLNLGLFHYALLSFCIYGPGEAKKGPFDAGSFWDEMHQQYPTARNEEYLRDIFIEACQEYQARVLNAHNRYLEVKAANQKGGRHSAENRKAAAAQKNSQENESIDTQQATEQPETAKEDPPKNSKSSKYKPLSMIEARNLLRDIRDRGADSRYVHQYGIPRELYSCLDFDDDTTLSDGKNYFSESVNIRGSIPILSTLEQVYILVLYFSGYWVSMLNYFLDYKGFHMKSDGKIVPALPFIVWMVCDSMVKAGIQEKPTDSEIREHMRNTVESNVCMNGEKYVKCAFPKDLFKKYGPNQ